MHFCVASDLKERRRCLILLFGGTSGSNPHPKPRPNLTLTLALAPALTLTLALALPRRHLRLRQVDSRLPDGLAPRHLHRRLDRLDPNPGPNPNPNPALALTLPLTLALTLNRLSRPTRSAT